MFLFPLVLAPFISRTDKWQSDHKQILQSSEKWKKRKKHKWTPCTSLMSKVVFIIILGLHDFIDGEPVGLDDLVDGGAFVHPHVITQVERLHRRRRNRRQVSAAAGDCCLEARCWVPSSGSAAAVMAVVWWKGGGEIGFRRNSNRYLFGWGGEKANVEGKLWIWTETWKYINKIKIRIIE